VDDDLVALARRAGIDPVVKRGLGEQRERVRLLLSRRRFRGNVARNGACVCSVRLLVQRLARCGQRLLEHGACLGSQAPADDDHPVLVLVHVQGAGLVAVRGLTRLGERVDSTPAAHDALDVTGGAGLAHREQPFFGLRRGHAGQRAHLGVGQLPMGERVGQPGQRAESTRHTDPLTRGAQIHPDAPGQPVSACAEAVVPPAANVELADEIEQVGAGGLDVGRQLGDLVSKPIHLGNGSRVAVDDVDRVDLHRCVLLGSGDCTSRF
jgi:hypothetical protein